MSGQEFWDELDKAAAAIPDWVFAERSQAKSADHAAQPVAPPFDKPARAEGCTEDCEVDGAGYCEHAGFIQNAPAHGEGL